MFLRNYEYIRYMICSDSSRCKKFDLIEVDGMFICKIVMLFLISRLKLLLIVVKKDLLIDDQIFPIVKIVKNLFMYNISSLQIINTL